MSSEAEVEEEIDQGDDHASQVYTVLGVEQLVDRSVAAPGSSSTWLPRRSTCTPLCFVYRQPITVNRWRSMVNGKT